MKTRDKINKKIITSKIHKKMGMALNKRLLRDAVNAISLFLEEEFVHDRALYVENFGTLSPSIFHGHYGLNIQTGKIQEIKPFRTVKFYPHFVFLDLLALRRKNFLEKK